MDFINVLQNQPMIGIGRASDLCWIIFGKSYIEKNILGKEVDKGEYSLHLQCPWRIRDSTNFAIRLASGDIYEPSTGVEWCDSFDWDVQDNNLFDEKVKYLFPKNIPVFVKSVSISQTGDLKINFSNNLILECFVNISTDQECWRFFKRGDKEHLVVCGTGGGFQG